MKVVMTTYKDTGKFYEDAIVDMPEDICLHHTERIANIAVQHVPMLTDGYVHIRLTDEEAAKPGAKFFNHLFPVEILKSAL